MLPLTPTVEIRPRGTTSYAVLHGIITVRAIWVTAPPWEQVHLAAPHCHFIQRLKLFFSAALSVDDLPIVF